jgi:hypothetical protein
MLDKHHGLASSDKDTPATVGFIGRILMVDEKRALFFRYPTKGTVLGSSLIRDDAHEKNQAYYVDGYFFPRSAAYLRCLA